jgi:hypothetical protein
MSADPTPTSSTASSGSAPTSLPAWATSWDPADGHQQRERRSAGRPRRSREWLGGDRGHGRDDR